MYRKAGEDVAVLVPLGLLPRGRRLAVSRQGESWPLVASDELDEGGRRLLPIEQRAEGGRQRRRVEGAIGSAML